MIYLKPKLQYQETIARSTGVMIFSSLCCLNNFIMFFTSWAKFSCCEKTNKSTSVICKLISIEYTIC